MKAKMRRWPAVGLACGMGILLAACGDQAGSTAVLGAVSTAVPLRGVIAKDTPLKVDSLQATVRQPGGIGIRRHPAAPFVQGSAIALDTAIESKAFTVSVDGFQSSGRQRIRRWWASARDSARTADSLQTVLLSLTKGPSLDSLPKVDSFKVGAVVPVRKSPALWYTLDSSDPRVSGTARHDTASVRIISGQLWKIALKSDSIPSTGQPALWSDTTHWNFKANTPAPSFSLLPGTYTTSQLVTLTDSVPASISYSLDGINWLPYSAPLTISANLTLRARALAPGMDSSRPASAAYVIAPYAGAPTFGLPSGTYASERKVAILDTTPGAQLLCSADSLVWATCPDSFALTRTTFLHAYAIKEGRTPSPVSTAHYEMKVPDPTFSLPGGVYDSTLTITAAVPLPGAAVVTSSDSLTWASAASLVVASPRRIYAYATRDGWTPSAIVHADYAFSDTLTTLHSLTVDSGVLSPVFDSLHASYLDSVPSSLRTLAVTSVPSSRSAILTVGGAAASASTPALLDVSSDTVLSILVRNPRTGATRSYALSVIHRVPQLSGLAPSEGFLAPTFSSNVHAYVDSVNSSASSLTVTVTASDALWIDGAKATSGVPFSLAPPSAAAVSYVILDSSIQTRKAVRCTLTLAPTTWNTKSSITYGTISWKGRSYRTTTIGSQTWMAEDLNLRSLNGTDTLGSCYDETQANCDVYGRLYTWTEAMNGAVASDAAPSGVRGLCPDGWHLPSKAEWDVLFTRTITGYPTVDTNWSLPLRATASSWNGTDAFGFRGLPAGGKYPSSADLNQETHFWTSNSDAAGKAWTAKFKNDASPFENLDRSFAYPIRCLKD
jgi:uncharacterized protein (TIGR02145 family)